MLKRISVLLLFISTTVAAQIPQEITYQGMLLGSDEQPVAEGQYKLTFKIYNESGTELWSEIQNQVFIAGGLFQVYLGSVNPINLTFAEPYFLGIQIGSDPELQPRMYLSAVPYSIRAEDANTVSGIGASDTPEPGVLFPLGNDGKFPSSVLPAAVSGNYLRKNDAVTSRITTSGPVILISNLGNGDGINGRSIGGEGMAGRSDNNNGVSGWTGDSDKSGVFGHSTDGRGVAGRSDKNDGVVGWTGGSDKSGVFGHSVDGLGITGQSDNSYGVYGSSKTGYGGFFRSDNDHYDLALGGAVGRINTDPNNQNSNLILSSNNDVTIRLDNDGGESAVFRIKNSVGSDVCTVDEEGDLKLYYNGNTVVELGYGLDYAEGFNVSNNDKIGAGTVLIIDPDNPGQLTISYNGYDHKVAGIVAGAKGLGSGVRLGANQFDYDVALAGRVYCNVDASYGEIVPGDLLTTSPTPGYAMGVQDYHKAQGAILGKAMEKLAKGRKSQILVLVTLQ